MKKTIGILSLTMLALTYAGCRNANAGSSPAAIGGQSESVSQAGEDGVVVGTETSQFKVVNNLLISDNLPLVVDFNATWCGPCRAFSPIFHNVAGKYQGQAVFVSIDTDQYPEIAQAYKISAIPTVVFIMPGGGILGQKTGLMTEEEFIDFVNQLVDTSAGMDGSI